MRLLEELTLDVGEGVVDTAADRSRAADDGNGNESRDQAVFDGRCAGFVFHEFDEGLHDWYSLPRFLDFEQKTAALALQQTVFLLLCWKVNCKIRKLMKRFYYVCII